MGLVCGACPRPAGQGMRLCPGCGDRMSDHLHAVPALLGELDVTRARLDVLVPPAGRGGEQGLPFGQAAADAYHRLVTTVDYWSVMLACVRGVDPPTAPPEAALWLARRLDWLRALETAGDACCALDTAMGRAYTAIDRPMHRTAFPVGPCPETRGTEYCPGEVWAWIPVRIDMTPATLRCRHPECQRHQEPWTTEQWYRAGIRIRRRVEDIKLVGRHSSVKGVE